VWLFRVAELFSCDFETVLHFADVGSLDFDCGFTAPSPIWLQPSREVPCGISDIPGTMPRHSISSRNIVGGGARASLFVCG
jgi:hypothetical protein